MKPLYKILRCLNYTILTLLAVIVIFMTVSVIADYKPDKEIILFENNTPDILPDTLTLKFIDWNIGYCGLDESMDFFYDGGKQVRPEKKSVKKNLNEITNFILAQSEPDFILLQEVDKNSKRSYHINQFDFLSGTFAGYNTSMGINYKVLFVPVPLNNPMGKTLSGVMTLSKYIPKNITRISFEGNFPFPTGLFMLDRCFLVNRYNVSGGKELIVINTHNSAFDDGTLRAKQMKQLREFLLKEYDRGNYIIAGGDWNQCPAGVVQKIPGWQFDTVNFMKIENNYLPTNWKWAFRNNVPTNRRNRTPYKKEISPTTILDFFLVSPNIDVLFTENVNLEFKNSDHNPVKAAFRLKSK